MVIYLNNFPFSTIKRDGIILIQSDLLWAFLRVPPDFWPSTEAQLTTPGENRYESGPYLSVEDTLSLLSDLSTDYLSEEDMDYFNEFLEISLKNRWERQPEFTPLYRWWRPL